MLNYNTDIQDQSMDEERAIHETIYPTNLSN